MNGEKDRQAKRRKICPYLTSEKGEKERERDNRSIMTGLPVWPLTDRPKRPKKKSAILFLAIQYSKWLPVKCRPGLGFDERNPSRTDVRSTKFGPPHVATLSPLFSSSSSSSFRRFPFNSRPRFLGDVTTTTISSSSLSLGSVFSVVVEVVEDGETHTQHTWARGGTELSPFWLPPPPLPSEKISTLHQNPEIWLLDPTFEKKNRKSNLP